MGAIVTPAEARAESRESGQVSMAKGKPLDPRALYKCVMCHKEKPLGPTSDRLLYARYLGHELGVTCAPCRKEHKFYDDGKIDHNPPVVGLPTPKVPDPRQQRITSDAYECRGPNAESK